MTYRKRLLCLGLVLIFAVSLTACGQSRSGTDVPTTAASTQGSQSEQEEPAEPTADAEQTASTSTLPTDSEAADGMVYNGLFDTDRVHSIDVTISDTDWADLRENPLSKTKYHATVVIDGETVEEVSFATKGNTSLSFVASDKDSDRYSFKLNFGKYNKGQTYHGLNKLSLNNLYADATFLKDYLSYGIFRKLGVDAPLVSYVWLTVNGADHGLYIAIEDVSESWMERTNDGEGVVYKPETEQLNQVDGNPGGQFPTPPNGDGNGQFPTPPNGDGNGQFPTPPNGDGNGQFPTPSNGDGQSGFPGRGDGQNGFPGRGDGQNGGPGGGPGGWPGGGPGGFGSTATGADLAYNGDALEQYTDIFDNAETKADEEDERRVIAALKALSERSELESYLDTEEIIRYFAAHNFVLNYDSYTGNMLHNYYLYEKNGKLSMLPWDYNLAFGAFGGMGPGGSSDATALINTGIDSPLNGATASARPMWAWIAEDETYLSQYHAALDELLTTYFESGDFAQELDRLYAMLRPYVEKDPTAFYTVEEFDTAVATLKQVCLLRAASIRAQLDGTLAATTAEQDAAAKIDASAIDISSMGSHQGGPGGREDFQKGWQQPPAGGQSDGENSSQLTDGSTHATP